MNWTSAIRRRLKWKRLGQLLVALVLLALLRIAYVHVSLEVAIPGPPPTTLRQLLEQRGHWERNRELIAQLEVDANARLGKSPIAGSGFGPLSTWNTVLEDGTLLRFFSNGVLFRFGKLSGMGFKETTPAPGDTPLSQDEARAQVQRLVDTLTLDASNFDDLRYEVPAGNITYRESNNSPAIDPVPDAPATGQWEITVPRYYQDVLCAATLMVAVDIETGRIKEITNIPFVPPASMEDNISEEEAVSVAKMRASRKGIPIGPSEKRKLLVTRRSMLKHVFGVPQKSILCWAIKFEQPTVLDHNHPFTVYVQCSNGKVFDEVSF